MRLKYVGHERTLGGDVFLTVEVRRWWWPFPRRREFFKRETYSSDWIDEHGVEPPFWRELTAMLRFAVARERQLEELLAEEKREPLRLAGRTRDG